LFWQKEQQSFGLTDIADILVTIYSIIMHYKHRAHPTYTNWGDKIFFARSACEFTILYPPPRYGIRGTAPAHNDYTVRYSSTQLSNINNSQPTAYCAKCTCAARASRKTLENKYV